MALSPSLQQFKSSGVYRLEFDKSQIISIPSDTIRLVIGFSKTGPFNTPVLISDSSTFTTIFGSIDTVLERKGSFFHRTVLTCLDRGPVIVLNLLALDDTQDKSQFQSISTSASDANADVHYAPVSHFFNRDKFWYTDPNALLSVADNSSYQSVYSQRLFNIANVGRKPISVLTRKSDIGGFDVTANAWYGVGKVPEFLNATDYISDYLVDFIIVDGDFSDYTSLSIDPIFGPYFDVKGLKKTYIDNYGNETDGITAFLSLPSVNVLGVYTGSLIPEFQDKNNNNIYIADLVNLETSKTGILLGINQDAFDNSGSDEFTIGGVAGRSISSDLIDTVGHTIESEHPSVLNFLSYYGSINENLTYPSSIDPISYYAVAATAGQAGANALLSASTLLQGLSGYDSSTDFDTVTIYGPTAVLPSGFVSYYTDQTDFLGDVSEIEIGKTFISSGVVGTSSSVNFSSISSKSYSALHNTLTLKIANFIDPSLNITGPTGSVGFMRIHPQGTVTTSGGVHTLPIIFNNAWTFNPDNYITVGQDSNVYQDILNGILTEGDKVYLTDTLGFGPFGYISINKSSSNDFSSDNPDVFEGLSPVFDKNISSYGILAFHNSDLTSVVDISYDGGDGPFGFISKTGNIDEALPIEPSRTLGSLPNSLTNIVWFDNTANGPFGLGGFTGKIKVGQYLSQNFGGVDNPSLINPITGKSRLTKITSVTQITNPLSSDYGFMKVVTNDPIYFDLTDAMQILVKRYQDIRGFVDHYKFSTLKGYSLRNAQIPDGSITRQDEILDVMYNSNIAKALADKEVITYRYIVDTFQGGIEPASKIRYSKLALKQKSSLAIVNMPSVKQFKESNNPLFKMDSSSSFDTQYVPTGGNLATNPSNIFSLPGIADGANHVAFYGPNLIVRENGSNISVPPAAYVSNLYIDKYNLALPYSIVAGPRRGVVTGTGLVGVEYNFDQTDLDNIEPFGYNAIVNKKGFGLTINANQTAQQTVKSALSQIHVRELLIYIEDGLEAILKNYRWEFNTAQNRLEIKTLADNFMTQILSDGGVYDFSNIMDTTNNTPEVIDSNIGILDTYIEPVRGMGILVNRLTILKTGTIASGNYI
jgi:hypothetical protein